MATCIECAIEKPAAEFYAHSAMASGHVNVCKECHKMRVKIRRRTNPYVQEYDRERAKRPERKKDKPDRLRAFRAKSPAADRAHRAVAYAVRTGKLTKLPCEFCGREDVHAHHKDYSKPLDVIWLCPKCHHRLHANFPELEGKMRAEA